MSSYPFSVSRINLILSLLIVLVWTFIIVYSITAVVGIEITKDMAIWCNCILLVLCGIVFFVLLLTKGKSEIATSKNKKESELLTMEFTK